MIGFFQDYAGKRVPCGTATALFKEFRCQVSGVREPSSKT
ncbi:hypothetical protein D1AOALGA4SA_2544 [Olavius algarvensis Delta 1 endosymbiont]|nr:hypothetical protein D1AOALGA4SA_2544 [Olavius algarvensis Delta 1 endosymbiont]